MRVFIGLAVISLRSASFIAAFAPSKPFGIERATKLQAEIRPPTEKAEGTLTCLSDETVSEPRFRAVAPTK